MSSLVATFTAMRLVRFAGSIAACCVCGAFGSDLTLPDNPSLELPPVGAHQLRLITPRILELTLVTTKPPPPAAPEQWNFIAQNGPTRLPAADDFQVLADNKRIPVNKVGFKRRVIYAPFKDRDLRIGNSLYLQLADEVRDGQAIEVKNPRAKLWPATVQFKAQQSPLRWNPAIHVNQTGYQPSSSKLAMVGYYLGSLGELDLETCQPASAGTLKAASPGTNRPFELIQASSSNTVFRGVLKPRVDRGFPYPCYQEVMEADFSDFKTPGQYRLLIPGLGTSFPFFIDEGIAGAFARSYALGLYHQRCGMANEMPFTRFTHAACHLPPAEVPTKSSKFDSVNDSLAKESADFKENPRHTAPQLSNVTASLYPFVNRGPVDVHGGHHDAGDYSKYTINSAGFIHHLVFAADVFPGVKDLDNLGIPESGDGKSDILQEAKWEADFLARMQDSDGGFYFLVYPRDREYEGDVLPDRGDPQIVFPKTTSVTAAATAALAQCASSPTFKAQFPEAAALYLEKARKGWEFLQHAITKFGKDGAYQKITHYGNDFMHDDELTWAACELFLATGEPSFQKQLMEWLNPADPETRKWGWLRLYDAYGNAIRSYAFAARAGKLKREQLHPMLLGQCEAEIAETGQDQLRRAQQCAYGTSFPEETKRARAAGWYFSSDAAYDLAVACQIDWPEKKDPRPEMRAALLSNLNYEEGCNPVNMTYLTGLGWLRQHEIVHQFAQNDRRVLPPTGIPLGNIQASFGWTDRYKSEPTDLTFPSDGDENAPYPLYDRWSDNFNLTQEFVIVNQARALGYLAWLMAQTPLKSQPWKPVSGQIACNPETAGGNYIAKVTAPGIDLSSARIVWEAKGRQPVIGQTFSFVPERIGSTWIEAEAQLPDGRRIFAKTDFKAR